MPSSQHYFRKALDEYTHDFDSPDNKISDPLAARQHIAMDKPNIGNEISTKGKISHDYIKNLIDNKNLGESKIKCLTGFIENKIDHRTLLRLKTHLFDRVQGEEIAVDQWNNCKDRYLHIFPEKVEKDLLSEITVSLLIFYYFIMFIFRMKTATSQEQSLEIFLMHISSYLSRSKETKTRVRVFIIL